MHVWFPINRALAFVAQGVMAFHITGPQNRFTGCYIDGSRAVFEGAGLGGNVWTGGFECCAGSGLGEVPHGIELHGDAIGPGLVIKDNIFRGGWVFATPATAGATPTLTGSVIEANGFSSHAAGSRATQTLVSATPLAAWAFDFCAQLVVPSIALVTSVVVTPGAAVDYGVAVPAVAGCVVNVTTTSAFAGRVTVSVDASTLSAAVI